MTTGELFRHAAHAVLSVALLVFLMSKHAEHVDDGERMVWACMVAWYAGSVTVLWLVMRAGSWQRRHTVGLAAVALLIALLNCGPGIVRLLTVATRRLPGEAVEQTFARHAQELRHAAMEIDLDRQVRHAPDAQDHAEER